MARRRAPSGNPQASPIMLVEGGSVTMSVTCVVDMVWEDFKASWYNIQIKQVVI